MSGNESNEKFFQIFQGRVIYRIRAQHSPAWCVLSVKRDRPLELFSSGKWPQCWFVRRFYRT